MGALGVRLVDAIHAPNKSLGEAENREVQNLSLVRGVRWERDRNAHNLTNVEVSPCEMLARGGFRVGDVVRRSGGVIGRVQGEFAFRAVVRDIRSSVGGGMLVAISELRLIGRPNNSAVVTAREFIGTVVDLDLKFADGDPIVPGDRVLTEKGLATVAAVDGKDLWVQVDRATRLNAGLLKYGGKVKLIRRILALREIAGIMAGDIVRVGEKKYLARMEEEQEVILEALGNPGEVIRETEIAEAAPVLVLRPELPGSVLVDVGKGMRGLFSVSTADFRGKRVMPGDVVEVLGKQFDVVGERADAVWLKPVGELDLVTLQPQALIDSKVVKIIEFADGGLKYRDQ
jgi:hypothetical protein